MPTHSTGVGFGGPSPFLRIGISHSYHGGARSTNRSPGKTASSRGKAELAPRFLRDISKGVGSSGDRSSGDTIPILIRPIARVSRDIGRENGGEFAGARHS